MSPSRTSAAFISLLALGLAGARAVEPVPPPTLSEIPATFTPKTDSFDYVRRDEMVAMRDGVKLRTIVLVPKGAKDAPILLARTPYNAAERMSRTKSSRLISVAPQMMDTAIEAGYIVAYQDVRGKHGSEGDYVMNRPLRGPLNRDRHRSRDGHLRHDRMAGAQRPREQRPRRHDRRVLRRVHGADVDRASAPGTQGDRAVRADGGRLDGRRLVPQRRVPRRGRARVHLRPAGNARQQREMVERCVRHLRCVAARRLRRQHRGLARTRAGGILAPARGTPGLRRLVAGAGHGPRAREGTAVGADADRRRTVRPGRHLRGARALQGARTQGSGGPLRAPRARAMEPWTEPARRPRHRHGPVRGRHRGMVPPRGHAALPRPSPQGRSAAGHAARPRLRDRRERLASLRRLATRLRRGLPGAKPGPVPAGRGSARLRGAGRAQAGLRRIHIRPGTSPFRIGCGRR